MRHLIKKPDEKKLHRERICQIHPVQHNPEQFFVKFIALILASVNIKHRKWAECKIENDKSQINRIAVDND